jgi:hypothetical protein
MRESRCRFADFWSGKTPTAWATGPRKDSKKTMSIKAAPKKTTSLRRALGLSQLAIALACAALPAAITLAVSATPAQAANWIEVSCENPNLSTAPSEGWTSFASGAGSGSNNATSCGAGSPMLAILSTDAPVQVGANETFQYTPPAGSTLAGGSVDVALDGDGYGNDASGTAIAYSPEYAYNGSNVILQCSSGQPACSTGGAPYDYAGVLALPSNRGGNFYLSAGCGGSEGQACDEGGSEGAWSSVRLWWANFLLSNSSTPTAGSFGGPLLGAGARGTQELTFTASDPAGPGIYNVSIQVDGQTLYSGTPDTNGGKCASVGSSGGALMFDYSQPCRQSESVDLPIDTASLTDGQHTLKVTVQDAAGNTSVVYDATISTHNAPVNSSLPGIEASDPQTTVGTQLSATNGAWEAPSGAGTVGYSGQWLRCDTSGGNCQPVSGATLPAYTIASADIGSTLRYQVTAKNDAGTALAVSPASAVVPNTQQNSAPPGPGGPLPEPSLPAPTGAGPAGTQIVLQALGAANGTNASEAAYIHLGVTSTINSPYSKSNMTIRGRLLDPEGQPISGATLEVLQQVAITGAPMRKIGLAHTARDGSFTTRIPKGPSRLIRLAYRAFANEATYAFTRNIVQHVSTGLTLRVSPPQTAPHGRITLTGRVLGGYLGPLHPVVELLVKYLGAWRVFWTGRCKGNGAFKAHYKFLGGTGLFPFRARVRASTGRPYTLGYSTPYAIRAG